MIDFSPFVADLFEVVQVVVLGLAGVLATYATRWVLKKTHLDGLIQEDLIRNYLYTALENAIKFGIAQAETKVADKASVDFKNEILATAVNYILTKVPDAIAHFGLSDEAIRDLLVARLTDYLGMDAPEVPATAAIA